MFDCTDGGSKYLLLFFIIICILPSDPEKKVLTDICAQTALLFDIVSTNMPPLCGWICPGTSFWSKPELQYWKFSHFNHSPRLSVS
jgi:hypothetical protein